MVLKNLWRRKGRTLLTVGGISIGVAVVVALLALADGMTEQTAVATSRDTIGSVQGVALAVEYCALTRLDRACL